MQHFVQPWNLSASTFRRWRFVQQFCFHRRKRGFTNKPLDRHHRLIPFPYRPYWYRPNKELIQMSLFLEDTNHRKADNSYSFLSLLSCLTFSLGEKKETRRMKPWYSKSYLAFVTSCELMLSFQSFWCKKQRIWKKRTCCTVWWNALGPRETVNTFFVLFLLFSCLSMVWIKAL